MKRFGLLLGASVMILDVACASQHGTVLLQGESGQESVAICTGCELIVNLPGNPTTGYIWEITSLDAEVVHQVGGPEFRPESKLIGAGGTITFRFTGIKAGTANMMFAYRRPFEKDTPPIKTRKIRVEVSR